MGTPCELASGLPPEQALVDAIASMCAAIDDEIRAGQSDLSGAFRVTNGTCLHASDAGCLYSFELDSELRLPPETPLSLTLPSAVRVGGSLVAVHDFDLVLHLGVWVGDTVPRAVVRARPDFVWEQLRQRLEAEGFGSTRSRRRLLELLGFGRPLELALGSLACGAFGPAVGLPWAVPADAAAAMPGAGRSGTLDPDQAAALAGCLAHGLYFVWGPPGTGKTLCLAQTARALTLAGESVLVLAHANAAVDAATLRLAAALQADGELTPGRLLRVGTPRVPELVERPELLLDGLVELRQPDLCARRRLLEQRRSLLVHAGRLSATPEARARTGAELREVRRELARISADLRAVEAQAVGSAQVVCCTLSHLAVGGTVWRRGADAVMVDEISMAPFPAVFAAGLAARRRLLLFGDFRQLPPIVRSETPAAARWFGRDAFEVSGVRTRLEQGEPDRRVTLLRTQYRMSAAITHVVNTLAYRGQLQVALEAEAATRPLKARAPWAGAATVLISSTSLHPACFVEPAADAHSRANPLHACLAVELARQAVAAGSDRVAVVTPYRAQAGLIAAMVRDQGLGNQVRAGTVHRFQGAESDCVIVDLVDAPGQATASRLTGRHPETALRLLTVALSRARGKLLVLADAAFVWHRHPPGSPVRRALGILQHAESAISVSAAELVAEGRAPAGWCLGVWNQAAEQIAAQIAASPSAATLNLPAGFVPSDALVDAVRQASRSGRRTRVNVDHAQARRLQGTVADVRLLTRPTGLFCLVRPARAWIGGLDPRGLVFCVDGSHTFGVLEPLLTGEDGAVAAEGGAVAPG